MKWAWQLQPDPSSCDHSWRGRAYSARYADDAAIPHARGKICAQCRGDELLSGHARFGSMLRSLARPPTQGQCRARRRGAGASLALQTCPSPNWCVLLLGEGCPLPALTRVARPSAAVAAPIRRDDQRRSAETFRNKDGGSIDRTSKKTGSGAAEHFPAQSTHAE